MIRTDRSGAGGVGGVVVPMVTPVTATGRLDEDAVRRIVEHLVAGRVHGVFVLGTTGEAASLSSEMRLRLVQILVQQAAGRVRTYAGIGDNCLCHSLRAAEEYLACGVEVLVAHLPTYYALSAEEQFAYYWTLVEAIEGPLMIYNIPSTTHMAIAIDVLCQLADHPRIIGLKDSQNDVARFQSVMAALGGRDDFAVLAGAAALSSQALALGAVGMVPSSGNLVPAACRALYDAGTRGDVTESEVWQADIDAVASLYNRGRTLGGSLAALKATMGALDLCGPDMLPPLHRLGDAHVADLQASWRTMQSRWPQPAAS